MIIPELVEHNFSRDPDYYNDLAGTQEDVAERLSDLIKEKTVQSKLSTILEIGCGTGFLTQNIIDRLPGIQFTVTDISSSMLDYCRNRIKKSGDAGNCDFKVCDITKGCPEGEFSLITSSLAFQWVEKKGDLFKDLHAHLGKNGQLIFTTLLEGTFANIEKIFDKYNSEFPIPELASICDLKESLSCFDKVEIVEGTYIEKYKSIKDFLDHIHKVGAGNATEKRVPMSKLRKIIKEEKKNGEIIAEYRVAFVVGKK